MVKVHDNLFIYITMEYIFTLIAPTDEKKTKNGS